MEILPRPSLRDSKDLGRDRYPALACWAKSSPALRASWSCPTLRVSEHVVYGARNCCREASLRDSKILGEGWVPSTGVLG